MPERVAIVGAGPAGMALALALHKQGIASELFEARARSRAMDDRRILALSHGARQILEWLGAWNAIPHTAIRAIDVSQQGGLGRTRMTAGDERLPALGYVMDAGDLARSLDAALASIGIRYHEHTHVSAATKPQAPLAVWAEGAIDSPGAVARDYDQHAVICTATLDAPHGGTAWERFTPQGPVAVLPYGGPDSAEVAVVLTCAADETKSVSQLDDASFLSLLQERFGPRLKFVAAATRRDFPLGLRYRRNPVGDREVWIGNAAQTLHPVGGQGFNLALRDIFELARCLADAGDPGAAPVLSRYAARRRLDRHGAIRLTDGLLHVFANANPLVHHARGAGLLALDLLPPLRSLLARRMIFGARAW